MIRNQKKIKSEHIAEFLNFLDECKREYGIAYEQVGIEEKLRSDIYHKLELDRPSASEKGKLATQLTVSGQTRRYYKDIEEELYPIANYITEHKKDIDLLREVLGKVRKAETNHQIGARKYYPRIRMEDLLTAKDIKK